MKNIENYIDTLGHLAKDKVTNFEGVITSISFDLYGCIQAIVTSRKIDDKGDSVSKWFDINRLN